MSTKMDITIGRDLTINTGNYSSIKPSISVTLKDVDSGDIDNEYARLSELADALIALEVLKIGNEMNEIMDRGFKTYLKTIEASEGPIKSEVVKFIRKGII
jgi:activator of HSP90 ATPase